MGTKTISIMTDVYKMLRARRRSGESFSDVLRRTLGERASIMQCAGAWEHVKGRDIEATRKEIKKLRKRSTAELLRQT